MGIGENVGENVGENTGSAGSTYVGTTPVVVGMIVDDSSQLLTVNFNTGVKAPLDDFASGFALTINALSSSIIESDITGAGNGVLIFTITSVVEGDALELVYTDVSGGINSVLGDVQLADQTISYNVVGAVIFSDDFESGTLSRGTPQENGYEWQNQVATAVSTDSSFTGIYSLKFTFPVKNNNGFSFSEQRFNLGGNYPELWVKYDLFIPANYSHDDNPTFADNNKFVYFWSGNYSANFNGPGLSVQNWPSVGITSKGTPKAKGDPLVGGGFRFDKHYHDAAGPIIETADFGKWVTITIHIKYATSANNDGIFRLWKEREGTVYTIIDKTDGNWYVPGQPGFDQGYLLGWANAGYSTETIFYIDNIIFSTSSLL